MAPLHLFCLLCALLLRTSALSSPSRSAGHLHGSADASSHHQVTLVTQPEHRLQPQRLAAAEDEARHGDHRAPPPRSLARQTLRVLVDALGVMQHEWFATWIGTWPSGIDWTRAVLDTHLIASAASLTRSLARSQAESPALVESRQIENEVNRLFAQNIAYYFGEDAFAVRGQAYDDMLWIVLGWLESIKFINNKSQFHHAFVDDNDGAARPPSSTSSWYGEQFTPGFAHRARVFWDLTTDGWDSALCGGGMTWNPRLDPYKNAITNQLFIAASVGMYLYHPGDDISSPFMNAHENNVELPPVGPFDLKYLQAATNGYDWLKNSNMTNARGLYVDGFHVRNWRGGGTECNSRNEMVYTYNQGVILSGLRGLWESTGNQSYLIDGHQLARNAIRASGWALEGETAPDPLRWAGLGRGGVLEDYCDAHGTCNQDAQTFKGIFMHHLTLLCEPLPLQPVVPGKTFAASRDLAYLHRQSCKEYARWVAHNADAALNTRDEDGKFGGWWGATSDVDAELQPLPLGAIDYRNNPSKLSQQPWTASTEAEYHSAARVDISSAMQAVIHQLSSANTAHQDATSKRDLNDRGRGRTVETQSGGIAVLRALWELQNND